MMRSSDFPNSVQPGHCLPSSSAEVCTFNSWRGWLGGLIRRHQTQWKAGLPPWKQEIHECGHSGCQNNFHQALFLIQFPECQLPFKRETEKGEKWKDSTNFICIFRVSSHPLNVHFRCELVAWHLRKISTRKDKSKTDTKQSIGRNWNNLRRKKTLK